MEVPMSLEAVTSMRSDPDGSNVALYRQCCTAIAKMELWQAMHRVTAKALILPEHAPGDAEPQPSVGGCCWHSYNTQATLMSIN